MSAVPAQPVGAGRYTIDLVDGPPRSRRRRADAVGAPRRRGALGRARPRPRPTPRRCGRRARASARPAGVGAGPAAGPGGGASPSTCITVRTTRCPSTPVSRAWSPSTTSPSSTIPNGTSGARSSCSAGPSAWRRAAPMPSCASVVAPRSASASCARRRAGCSSFPTASTTTGSAPRRRRLGRLSTTRRATRVSDDEHLRRLGVRGPLCPVRGDARAPQGGPRPRGRLRPRGREARRAVAGPRRPARAGGSRRYAGPSARRVSPTGSCRTGYVPDDAVPALLRQAAVAAYPALEEGFGLPALEALACGTPLVTTAGTAMAEVSGGAAVLVTPGSVSELAEALGGRPRGRRRGATTPPTGGGGGRRSHLGGERGGARVGLPVGGATIRSFVTGSGGRSPVRFGACVPW